MSHLESYQALVLNADYRPISTYPVSSWNWSEAVKADVMGKVTVVSYYDKVVHSARDSFFIPSVIALNDYVDLARPAPLNRLNLFVRDRLSCVYCGGKFHTTDLTFDHVIPVSKGGVSSWENLASACLSCNQKKANRTPKQAGMATRTNIFRPTLAELNAIGTKLPLQRDVPTSWRDWLYWNVDLE